MNLSSSLSINRQTKEGQINAVGQLKFNTFKRSYHSLNNKIISELYLNRKAPIKPFEEKIVSTCKDLLSSTALNTFFKDLKGQGGIYMFTYKSDSNIYYIGRAKVRGTL